MSDLAQTIQLGLIGRGIGASRSPEIHEAAACDAGLNASYQLFDFDTLGLADEEVGPTLKRLANAGFAGTNVTYPFKQSVVPLCDALSETADRLGAVNTIVFESGRLHGHNTDVGGFGWLLDREIGAIAGTRVAQVGAGGAGAATAFALLSRHVAQFVLFDPVTDRANDLIARLRASFPDADLQRADSAKHAFAGATGVVNATPVGMAKLPGTPVAAEAVGEARWIADVIYFPLETELLAMARRRGQRAVNGVAMVIGQAAEAFSLFTGVAPDRESMLARFSAASNQSG